MPRSCVLLLAVLAAHLTVSRGSRIVAEEELPESGVADALNRALDLADLVLEEHIDPPARQQMVLGMARALLGEAGARVARELGGRVSAIVTREEFLEVLTTLWRDVSRSKPLTLDELDARLTWGLRSAVPGTGHLESGKAHRVAKQFAENRYVGTGIYLGMRDERPTVVDVFEGGPMDRAGGKKGDVFEEIAGRDPEGLSVQEIIDLLRGPEGSEVRVVLRQPGEANPRTCTITRGVVPMETVAYRLVDDEAGAPIALLSLRRLTASSVHELRKHSLRMAEEGVRGAILDLRGSGGRDVHHAVLLADALLDGGVIGVLRTRQGTRTFTANRDCLFRELPLAVLVGEHTEGPAEWLAAALQDNERAVLVGERTAGAGWSRTAVPVPGRDDLLWLPTGLLEGGDGRAILKPRASRLTRRAAPPGVTSRHTEWGVVPDHRVPTPEGSSEDAVLDEAAKVLRARLARTLDEREV